MMQDFPTLIHKRVAMAQSGTNEMVICRMKSGWAVLGDDQRLKRYSLLLSDPVVESLNELSKASRGQFLSDMTVIGDALMAILEPSIINYSILGNTERALHAHIHPRYDDEEPDKRKTVPFIYQILEMPCLSSSCERDKELIDRLRAEIEKRM